MNKEMRKFYRKLMKMENMNVIFTKYNGMIICSENPENLNIPEGYSIVNNEVFSGDKKIGKIVQHNETEEIDLNDFDLEELSEEKEIKNDTEEDEKTIDFSNEDIDDDMDIEVEKEESNNKKVTIFGKIGYAIKKAFERDNDFVDFEEDEEDEEINESVKESANKKDLDFDEKDEIEFEIDEDIMGTDEELESEKKKPSIFSKIKNGIGYAIAKFFDHFGKKPEVEIPEDVIKKSGIKSNEPIVKKESDDDKKEPIVKKESDNVIDKDKEMIEKKFSEIELLFREINTIKNTNKDLDFSKFDDRITENFNKFQSLFNLYVNDGLIKATDLIALKSIVTVLKGEIEKYVIESTLNENEVNNKPRKVEFTSIEDTKAKFEEYDKPEKEFKEISEKIAYYEEFLSTHDLSHVDDQGMKERMEEKLSALKERYNEIMESKKDKNAENDLRTEKMAFYTQTAMGIDNAIDRMEKERQLKILQAELEGKTIINLGLVEERKIDAKKAELLRLKKECLERKAEVNKYYEEQAARMTNALKR